MGVNLEDVKEVFSSSNEEAVNNKLQAGWKLHKVLQSKVRTSEVEQIQPIYILFKI